MQLNWQSGAEPAADQESQSLMRAELPRGHEATIVALDDGRMVARIYDAVTGEESNRAVFASEAEAKAWVEDQAVHIATATPGATVIAAEQQPEPDASITVDVDEASEESFPASDAPAGPENLPER
jgi:hypothetical protein